MTNLEVGNIVLCTVDRIVGTVVFVKIDEGGEGSIILSEIAPGRIRNLREYVVPKKKIVCKVLRISGERIDLSLRRVTQKEQKEIKEEYKQEKSSQNILKSILGKKADKIISEISREEKVYEFMQKAKEKPTKLENLIGKDDTKKILDILKNQKQKKYSIKKEFSLTTSKPNGLTLIKNILKQEVKKAEIKYLSAGKYSIKIESTDIKIADSNLKEILKKLEKTAKQQEMEFSVKEK